MRVIDYDSVEEWAPWFSDALMRIPPPGLREALSQSNPRDINEAGDYTIAAIGRDRLVEHLNRELAGCAVRAYYGTRLTEPDLRSIKTEGLRALNLDNRREALRATLGRHPNWSSEKEQQFDTLVEGLKRGRAGGRENGRVHACVWRLLLGCNHYLKYGSEAELYIAEALFGESGRELLRLDRSAKLVSWTAPFSSGFPRDNLPELLRRLTDAWAFRVVNPSFSVVKQRNGSALSFEPPMLPGRLTIEHIDDGSLV
jgi:hypothetical protein